MGIITSFQQQRADWILPKIEVDSTVLDVGSGDGGVLLYLLNHQAFTPIAADISDYALAFLRDKGIETVKLNINNLDEISELPEVDHIIVFEVLEYVQNPEQFLKILEKKHKNPFSLVFQIQAIFLIGLEC